MFDQKKFTQNFGFDKEFFDQKLFLTNFLTKIFGLHFQLQK